MNDKDKILAEGGSKAVLESGLALVDVTVLHGLPLLTGTWNLCKSYLGAGLELRNKRALEWVDMVRDNPSVFGEALLADEDFQDAFACSLGEYLKLRGEEKRFLARAIFLGFASSGDRERFQLERLNNTLSVISVDAIEYLAFLNETIIPRMMKQIKEKADRLSKQNGGGERERQWWIDAGWRTETIWDHLEKWLHEEYNPNSPKVKERHHYDKETDTYDVDLQEIFDIEQQHRTRGREMMAEYVSLGLFRVGVEGGGSLGGSAKVEFTITNYGREFLSFIDGYKVFSPKLDAVEGDLGSDE